MKPVALLAYPIQNSSMRGCVVLDPFLGSGSTLMACEQTGRICYAMELDPKFCDVIRKRYFRFINKLNYDEDDTGWEDFTPKVEANHDGEKD